MKIRVKYYNSLYYPQYKGWFFWHFFCNGDTLVSRHSLDAAQDFLKEDADNKIVWEGTK